MKEIYDFLKAGGANEEHAQLGAFVASSKAGKIQQLESGASYDSKEIRQAIVHTSDDIAQLCYHNRIGNKISRSILNSIRLTNILIFILVILLVLRP